MNDFRFAELGWLHAIWLVGLLLIGLVFLELRRRSIMDRMIAPLMQGRLVLSPSGGRRFVAMAVLAATLVMLVIAMMRPQWGMKFRPAARIDSQIMVCLDVSRSMLAEDAVPNRLERAKSELEAMLGLMDESQQVGLTAFAGRAAVLCPMTTDFGFLRLILKEASPASVGRGGTKIGSAIRKAVKGFRDSGDVNRMIILITDGEDHDSLPLDAAKEAREKGVRIVCIGFGDEAGSKIQVTDPETGSRRFVKDRDGADVITRLDGETLRQIALETEGAYVPAGTGSLDLQSIYDRYISVMLSESIDGEEKAVHNDIYQWCVLAAISLLLVGQLVANPLSLSEKQTSHTAQVAALVVAMLGLLLANPPAVAQTAKPDTTKVDSKQDDSTNNDPLKKGKTESGSKEEELKEMPARQRYNQALALVQSDPEQAAKLLTRARRDAGIDGELRFRCLYNLGWVEVNRSQAVIKDKPKEALQYLEQAANRFREAIRLRPDNQDARHNLEIISRRILALADQLAKKDPRDIPTRLDKLIARLREQLQQLQQLVERQANANSDTLRREFRRQGVAQRQMISDMQKLADDARKLVDSFLQRQKQSANQPSQQNSQERVRMAQISGMLKHLEKCLQRMNKARSLTRRRQGNRGFVRWSSALSAAKQARDQLRNPIEVLGVLIAEANELLSLTHTKAKSGFKPLNAPTTIIPNWLTNDLLKQSQESLNNRLGELQNILTAGAKQQPTQPNPRDGPGDPSYGGRAKQLAERINQAMPLLKNASEQFDGAQKWLGKKSYRNANSHQFEGIRHLREAAEIFFDIRRLIEAMYAEQLEIQQRVSMTKDVPKAAFNLVETANKQQQKNSSRANRLGKMLDVELSQLTQPAAGTSGAQNQQTIQAKQQRIQQAKKTLASVVQGMAKNATGMGRLIKQLPITDKTETAVDSERKRVLALGKQTIEQIEALRRLFFSLVEHLRETARRQTDVNDKTIDASTEKPQVVQKKTGPLGDRQKELKRVAEQISKGLEKQAQQANQQLAVANKQGSKKQSSQQPKQQIEKAKKAAKALQSAARLVHEGQIRMGNAADQLQTKESTPPDFKSISEHQTVALKKLLEALALLDQQQNKKQQQNQNQQQSQQQQNSKPKNQKQRQNLSAKQLLQLIRDREAQRRKNRRKGRVGSGGVVDKDW